MLGRSAATCCAGELCGPDGADADGADGELAEAEPADEDGADGEAAGGEAPVGEAPDDEAPDGEAPDDESAGGDALDVARAEGSGERVTAAPEPPHAASTVMPPIAALTSTRVTTLDPTCGRRAGRCWDERWRREIRLRSRARAARGRTSRLSAVRYLPVCEWDVNASPGDARRSTRARRARVELDRARIAGARDCEHGLE
jgi:hypothetical protein